MGLLWHRPLTSEDVATAHRLIAQHQPTTPYQGAPYCANAGHWGRPPAWPCSRARWAQAVLTADDSGEISDEIRIGA